MQGVDRCEALVDIHCMEDVKLLSLAVEGVPSSMLDRSLPPKLQDLSFCPEDFWLLVGYYCRNTHSRTEGPACQPRIESVFVLAGMRMEVSPGGLRSQTG